jgi:predicted MFS family arabinose efflux permease
MSRGYAPVALVALATAFSLLGDQMLYSVLPTYYDSLGLTYIQVGVILSANRWIRFLTNHIAERALYHINVGLALSLALAAGAGVTALYGVASTFTMLLLGRLVWGLCWSFIRQSGLMTAADATTDSSVGAVMGSYNFIARLGSVAGNLVGAVGHDVFGFARTLFVFSAVSLLAVPLGAQSQRLVKHDGPRKRHERPSFRGSLGLWVCGFAAGCVGTGLVMSTLGLVLRDKVGESITVVGVVVGVATLNGLLLSARWVAGWSEPLWGAISDRIGRRQAALRYFAAGSVALLVGSQVQHPGYVVGCVLAFFLCGAATNVTVLAEAVRRGPRVTASYVTASDMGAAAGPLLGWAAPHFGLPSSAVFMLGGALYAVAAVVSHRSLTDAATDQPPDESAAA